MTQPFQYKDEIGKSPNEHAKFNTWIVIITYTWLEIHSVIVASNFVDFLPLGQKLDFICMIKWWFCKTSAKFFVYVRSFRSSYPGSRLPAFRGRTLISRQGSGGGHQQIPAAHLPINSIFEGFHLNFQMFRGFSIEIIKIITISMARSWFSISGEGVRGLLKN